MHSWLLALMQGWWQPSLRAPWRANRPGPSPTDGSALSVVPGLGALDSPPDQMHTWHLGVGQHFTGSMVAPHLNMIYCDKLSPFASFLLPACMPGSLGTASLQVEMVAGKQHPRAAEHCICQFR